MAIGPMGNAENGIASCLERNTQNGTRF